MFQPTASTCAGAAAGTASGIGVVDEAAGRQREPVDDTRRRRRTRSRVGLGGEGEDADEVGAVGRGLEDDQRVAVGVVVVLGEHEPVGRDDLEDAVHRRAEPAVRLDRGDERLALPERDREAVDVAVCGRACR